MNEPLFRNIVTARFIRRLNRFVVECRIRGKKVPAHLPNPGRLRELLLPGTNVYLTKGNGQSARSTRYTCVAVEREGHPVMLHTHLCNAIAARLISEKKIPGFEEFRVTGTEIPHGRSRFDLALTSGKTPFVLEVKSCTLFGRRIAMFPDAVTTRGRKHILELSRLSEQGMKTGVVFIVHSAHVDYFMPEYHVDPLFASALSAVRNKITIKAIGIEWQKDLSIGSPVRELAIPWDLLENENVNRGAYFLILKLSRNRKIMIGRIGEVHFRKGYYVYTGSAMHSLTGRTERHKRLRKMIHWHIDYLRQHAEFVAALPVRSRDDLECKMASSVRDIADWTVPAFGSSDCFCGGHLFGFNSHPLSSHAFIHRLIHFRIDRLEAFLE